MADKPEKAIRIVLADASRLTTLGITQVLEKEADMEILAVVTDGEEAVAKTIELEPDVLIIEVDLPQLSGIKATQKVRRELPHVAVVIINEKIFAKPAVATKVLAEFRELSVYGPGSSHVFAPLSPREVQILDNIAQGMTNKEVAYTLAISEQTVKNHMSSILRKLSVNDRTQAVVYAMRQGWIKGPEMSS